MLIFAGCNNAGSNSQNQNTDSTKSKTTIARQPVQSKLTAEGTQALVSVVSKYYALKNALVATKSSRVDSAAQQLAKDASNLQAFLPKDSANTVSLKLYMDTVITQSKMISAIKDESCEKQRLAFGTLSSAIYGLLKSADIKNAGIYHEYCPMAFNEKGAFWLSDETEIKNPYFGKKMLECGEVTDSL